MSCQLVICLIFFYCLRNSSFIAGAYVCTPVYQWFTSKVIKLLQQINDTLATLHTLFWVNILQFLRKNEQKLRFLSNLQLWIRKTSLFRGSTLQIPSVVVLLR